MTENFSLEKLNSLITFQRKVRFLKKELDTMNIKMSFLKDVLISMITNLSFCNNARVFQDTESNYLIILNELKEVKDLLDVFPDSLTFKTIHTEGLNTISLRLIKCENLIIKYANHIAPENLRYILKLLYNENWIEHFDSDDLNKIIFITRLFKPICVWYSESHKKEISITNTQSDTKKTSMLTKDLIETILGIKKSDDNKNNSIILSGESSLPSFLKNISDIVDANPKKLAIKRNNHFSKIECINNLGTDKIKIVKNSRSISLIEDKYGALIYIKINNNFVVLQGFFKDDLLNVSYSLKFVKEKINQHKSALNYEVLNIPKIFKDSYYKTLSLRDIIVLTPTELVDDIRKKYNDFKLLQGKPLLSLINEFLLASKYRKIDILTLLLMSSEEDKKVAFVLFDVFKSKDKKDISSDIYQSLHYSIRDMLDISKTKLEKEETDLTKLTDSDIPYERRINMLKADDDVKSKAMEKLKSMKASFQGDSKSQHWLDGLLKVPFGIYKENDILSFKENFINKIKSLDSTVSLFSDNQIDKYINSLPNTTDTNQQLATEWQKYKVDKKDYLVNIRKVLDDAVFGHKEAKLQLERIFAQWINGEAKGAVLGLQGPPGTGKTSLAKNGLSKCLTDKDGKPRPFAFLPIGGSVNGSTLVGHNFTYVGSTWGRIADILMTSGCMNPIIFIDEIDKVSHTEYGKEIISILTHMTDPTQNDEFEDKYFAGIKIDLTKALIVFSFNDPNLIDPILRDRITMVETHPLNITEKLTIIKDYMLPEICKEVGFSKDEIIFSDSIIKHLIETYTNEAGVRKIKEKIVAIVRDINLTRFHNNDITIPYNVTLEYVKELLEDHPKVRGKKISSAPAVGMVNGLYASTSGIGGITQIEVVKFPSDKMLDLNLTGQAGDVMKESVQYALKNAYRLLTPEQQDKMIEDSHNKKTFGLHIHCPDGATPKDGPSAGLAFTLAIYSVLTGKKIRNDVCMTGEINLNFDAMIIGGLEAKLNGGKKAGCVLALIPEDNMEDLEKMRRAGTSPEDDTFKVQAVKDIHDIIKYALVD